MRQFSVLMSLYIKEKPEFFVQCLNSVLSNTVIPDEIVIVLDGPITSELQATLNKLINENPKLYKIVPLKKNLGLGLALKEGILHCSYELIARMDTDDICRKDRFELQLGKFEQDSSLDICGSYIAEFEDNPEEIISRRKVPVAHDDIIKYQKKRSAFNHMTVMYKKSAVLKAGNYENCPLMEDDLLWARMILSGAKCSNIDDYLVFVRIGGGMIERRGGIKYFSKYKKARKRLKNLKFIGFRDYFISVCAQFVVCLLPYKLRRFVFLKMLRKNNE